jgi:hypothetical protein
MGSGGKGIFGAILRKIFTRDGGFKKKKFHT